ncbi:hypothetical protein B0J18DRAFT_220698 [Chaetomium sp. MPI-SDFR-AT-0129]|nr:hypothetical protein B0J18DRAFT_220698 [Chaetomium sp. MPI-SDFR-AT-0129]
MEPAESARCLRPRQAPGMPARPAGSAVPKAGGGRMTRSSAALTITSPTNRSSTVPPLLSIPVRSHKRARSSSKSASQSQQAKRTRPSTRKLGFYEEDSETWDDGDDEGDEDDEPLLRPSPKVEQKSTPRKQRNLKASRTTTPKKSKSLTRAIKSPLQQAAKKTPTAKDNTVAAEDSPFIPDWASLPYLILLQIFRDAAAPLTQLDQVKWLVATSGVCRAFAEPALTPLYEAPPLLTRSMTHGLVSLLAKDPSTTLFNYRNKVIELVVDVEEISSRTFKGRPLDLEGLVRNVPRLKSLQFLHWKDDPPYRSLEGNLRWSYPVSLFWGLNGDHNPGRGTPGHNHVRLAAWQWNRRLMGSDLNLDGIASLHQTPAFVGLEKVTFVNYQVPSLHAKEADDDHQIDTLDQEMIQKLANAINALPALKHLTFESSTAVNWRLLPLLPKNLESLELINCWDVKGEDFSSYLLSSGYRLKRLLLLHNQSLDLSFLTILGEACPNLRLLYVDCKTFNHHEFYHDSDPSYEQLLMAGQVPVWPESLESLQMLNMKKWTAEAAETLFRSLVDAAPKLPSLRRIDLKAMLSIPIQERSHLRNKWARKLKHIFLREFHDPAPLFSLRHRPPQDPGNSVKGVSKKSGTSRTTQKTTVPDVPSRRSSRITAKSSHPSSRASSIGRDLRHGLNRPSYADPDTDEDMDMDDEGGDELGERNEESAGPHSPAFSSRTGDGDGEEVTFRHGLCEKVEVQLDNQKSVETTLTMDDFLDDENDDLSDDDWMGEDEDSDGAYAW